MPFVLVLLVILGGATSLYLLLPVVPLYIAGEAGSDLAGGLATGALMVSTVSAELVMTPLLARFGYQLTLLMGLVLLGAPALLLPIWSALPLVLLVCLARGGGLGMVFVAGSALVAELVPTERRSEALGLYGVASSVTAILGLPLGVWLAQEVGFVPVFLAAAAAALLAVLAVVPLSLPAPTRARDASIRAGLQTPGLGRPSLVFLATTAAAGIIATFLPLALPADLRPLAWLLLLVQAVGATTARGVVGRVGDRFDTRRLLPAAMVAATLGVSTLVWSPNIAIVVVGMLVFGIGFGAAQNVTIALMFQRVTRAEYGMVSAMWNLAYDVGIGVGAVGFGAVSQLFGYPVGFGVTSTLLLGAVLLARRA